MVASSTVGKTTKTVLKNNESKLCSPDRETSDDCKVVRVKAAEFSNKRVKAAFLTLQVQKKELVATKTENGIYATQSNSIDASLNWTIMTMTPIETEKADQITSGSEFLLPLIVLANIGFLVCSTLVIFLIRYRKEREILCIDWRFMSAFVGGCAFLNASCLSFLGENTDELCLTRMWLVHFFAVFALSFLFVKTYRMYKLVGSGLTRVTISHIQTAQMALPLIGLQTLILLVFTFVDPYKRTEDIIIGDSNIVHRYVCDHNTPAFSITMLLYEGGLILTGCVLAFKTRKLEDDFNESKQILLAMYDIAVICCVMLILSHGGG